MFPFLFYRFFFLPFFYLDKFAYIETQCVIEFKCAKGHKIFVIFGREQIRETLWQMSHVIDHPTQLQGKHSYLKKRKSNEMHLLFCLLFFFQSIHISAEVAFFSIFIDRQSKSSFNDILYF